MWFVEGKNNGGCMFFVDLEKCFCWLKKFLGMHEFSFLLRTHYRLDFELVWELVKYQ